MFTRSLAARSEVNLWRVPALLTLGGGVLFALTMIPDVLDSYGVIHLPVWLTMGSIDDARAILSAMLGCVSTVLALIFSVALLVLSMVATLFGPRLLYRFLQDWITQATLGAFLATFVYLCLVFLVTHADAHTSFVPQVSLIMSWVLVVSSFGFLVYYCHRIAVSIQNPDMIARVVDDLRPSVITREKPKGRDFTPEEIEKHLAEAASFQAVRSGYIQEIDHDALVAIATREDAVIHIPFRPGQFVLEGETIASVCPKSRFEVLAPSLARCVVLGRHRTIHQDSEFGVAQIVEIGIRALSPAVNDTFTGVACVDWLGDALVVLAAAPPLEGHWTDANGKLRLRVRPLKLERIVKTAFDQIRQASNDNPAVLVRILDMIRRISPRMPTDASRAALLDQATAIHEAASNASLVTLDKNDIEAAWTRIQAAELTES